MTNPTLQTLAKRRTQYALGKTLPISEDAVDALVREAMRLTPSSFNSQSSRAVILFGAESVKFWDLTREILRAMVPADAFASTDAKMDSFAAGAGTVLFFEDEATIKELQKNFPLYADAFPIFSEHSAGMAQISVWNALAEENIGGSLQHYSNLVEADVAKTWNLPASWKLKAQMPFGSNEKGFAEKTYIDDAIRFKTFK